jgi:hypothetical protein
LRAAVDVLLAGMPGTPVPSPDRPVDEAWLAVGLRLGLERPAEARHLLGLVGVPAAGGAGSESPAPTTEAGTEADAAPAGDAGSPGAVAVRSMLLARSATLDPVEAATIRPETHYAWAAMLTPDEITWLGRVVQEQLDGGATQDLGRGFGIAWSGGVHVPHRDLQAMFAEFEELHLTIGSVLAGRDLRAITAPPPSRLAAWFGSWVPRERPGMQQASAALDSLGRPAQLGLVAAWNTWMAVRYREEMSAGLFDQLVRPWTTVVGRLPDA